MGWGVSGAARTRGEVSGVGGGEGRGGARPPPSLTARPPRAAAAVGPRARGRPRRPSPAQRSADGRCSLSDPRPPGRARPGASSSCRWVLLSGGRCLPGPPLPGRGGVGGGGRCVRGGGSALLFLAAARGKLRPALDCHPPPTRRYTPHTHTFQGRG